LQIIDKKFAAAVKTYQAAVKVEPNNPAFLNSLAYVQAFAGDLAGARASIEAYRKAAPNDANADDSLGEIHFFAGRYADAERNFVDAYRRNKALVGGHELYRAAVAAFLA